MQNVLSLLAILSFSSIWLVTEHLMPWVSWHTEVMAFAGVLLLAWAWVVNRVSRHQTDPVALSSIVLILIALGTVGTLQALLGVVSFWGDVWVNWFYIALCVICIVLGYGFIPRIKVSANPSATENAMPLLAYVLVGGAILSTAIAFVQTFDVWDLAGWVTGTGPQRRPGANLSQPNHLATFLVMGLASIAFLYQSKKLSSLSALVIGAFLLLGLVITESRAGVLSLLLLVLWFVVKKANLPTKISAWALIAPLFAFAGMFWTWPRFWSEFWRIESTMSVNVTSSGRLDLWSQICEVIALRPWFGWGFRQLAEGQNVKAHMHGDILAATYSHNLVLDLAVWFGVPVAVLAVLLTGRWLWRRVRDTRQLLSWYCLAVCLPVAVHSMLEFPFAYAYFLAPVMLALGALEASLGIQPLIRVSMRVFSGMLLVVSVAMAWSVVEYFEIEDDFRVARFEMLRVGQTPADHVRPKMIVLTQLGALVDVVRAVPGPGMSSDDLDLIRRVALHYPWSATLTRYALALSLNGNPEEGARQMEVIRHMFGEGTYLRTKERLKELQESSVSGQAEMKSP